jgi:hypothetical protein
MKKTMIAAALLALAVGSAAALTTLTGCHSDPHDTHIRTTVASPR